MRLITWIRHCGSEYFLHVQKKSRAGGIYGLRFLSRENLTENSFEILLNQHHTL
jgi:hypothetical protein